MLTAFWFCEDYRVFLKWHVPATAVDAFFPIQGEPFTSALAAAGVPVMPVLPMAAARDACFSSEPTTAACKLSFFGTPFRNRVAFFEALADLPLELHGLGWLDDAGGLLRPLVKNGNVLTEAEGFELFKTSAVNINLHSSPFHHGVDPHGDYVNPRAYEIAACAGFQLVDRRRDLPLSFEEDSEVVAFASAAELRAQFLRWINDPEGRRKIAMASRRRVLAEHTYEHRIRAALRALQITVPDASILS
jgi:spore maturation protein CgeB